MMMGKTERQKEERNKDEYEKEKTRGNKRKCY